MMTRKKRLYTKKLLRKHRLQQLKEVEEIAERAMDLKKRPLPGSKRIDQALEGCK